MNLSRSRRADYFWVFLRHQTIAICLRTILAIDGKTNNTKSSFSRCSIHNLQITYCMQSRLNVYILCLPLPARSWAAQFAILGFSSAAAPHQYEYFFFFRYTMAGCKMLYCNICLLHGKSVRQEITVADADPTIMITNSANQLTEV